MKLWGDVPWKGGPRKVIAVVTVHRLGAMLAYCGRPAETEDVWTLIYPEDLGERVFGQGVENSLLILLRLRGYRIEWR